jgi:hypothetical protein
MALPLLDQEQIDVLELLVQASRSVSREQRVPFWYRHVMNEHRALVDHPGFPDETVPILFTDIEVLGHAGFVAITREERYSGTFYVTPAGFRYYEAEKATTKAPLRQMEQNVTKYLDATLFENQFRGAYAKWRRADELLWSADSATQLSTIGHLCREAMQDFADELINRFPQTAPPSDKTKTVARIRTVLHVVRSESVRAFLDALLAYWGTLSDLVQRQEHAGGREGEDLTWDDARRVVFHTAIVMYEIITAVRSRAA